MNGFRPDHVMTFQELAALYQRIKGAHRVLTRNGGHDEFHVLGTAHCYTADVLQQFANAFRDLDHAVNYGGRIVTARREAQRLGAQVAKYLAGDRIRLEYGLLLPHPFPVRKEGQQ